MQVRSILLVMMNITFNLNVAARFFIVIYAPDFVKKGQVDLKLFHQIYWLAWMVTVGKKWELRHPSNFFAFISSDRSSCTDDGLSYIQSTHFFRFGAFMPFYTVTSITLSRLNSINARYLGDIFGISLGYLGDRGCS